MSVTVYTKPKCVACNATYRALDKKGIVYNSVDITTDPEALDKLKELGFQQAPVVDAPTGSWSGFNPDAIDALAEYYAEPVG